MPLRSHAHRHGKWLLVAFGLYLSAYLVLSRRGFAEADRTQSPGFYYVTPRDTDGWRLLNRTCGLLFRPLEILDQWLGTGREPASEPLFGLSGIGPGTTTDEVPNPPSMQLSPEPT